jgi:hypothetical protein
MTVYKLVSEYDDTVTFSINERVDIESVVDTISYIQFRAHDFGGEISNRKIFELLEKWFDTITELKRNFFGFGINVDDLWEANCGHYNKVISDTFLGRKAKELLDSQIKDSLYLNTH